MKGFENNYIFSNILKPSPLGTDIQCLTNGMEFVLTVKGKRVLCGGAQSAPTILGIIWRDSLSCFPQFGKMAINLVNCTQYQTNKLNPLLQTPKSIYFCTVCQDFLCIQYSIKEALSCVKNTLSVAFKFEGKR